MTRADNVILLVESICGDNDFFLDAYHEELLRGIDEGLLDAIKSVFSKKKKPEAPKRKEGTEGIKYDWSTGKSNGMMHYALMTHGGDRGNDFKAAAGYLRRVQGNFNRNASGPQGKKVSSEIEKAIDLLLDKAHARTVGYHTGKALASGHTVAHAYGH